MIAALSGSNALIECTMYHLPQNYYSTAPYFWTIRLGHRNVPSDTKLLLTKNYSENTYFRKNYESPA